MTVSKMTQRSNRLDARIDKLIEAQERFVTALSEALARFSQPVHIMGGPPDAARAGPWPSKRPLTPLDPEWSAYFDTLRVTAPPSEPLQPGSLSARPEDTERRLPRRETPDVADNFAPPLTDAQQTDEDHWNAGYDAAAFADMAAELAGDIEDDEPLPPQDDEGVWRKRLHLNALRLWQPEWGPRPGQAGCLVPAHLLNGRG